MAQDYITYRQDFVVRVNNTTGKATQAWPGQRYRAYKPGTTQYRVFMVNGPAEAKERAEEIHLLHPPRGSGDAR